MGPGSLLNRGLKRHSATSPLSQILGSLPFFSFLGRPLAGKSLNTLRFARYGD